MQAEGAVVLCNTAAKNTENAVRQLHVMLCCATLLQNANKLHMNYGAMMTPPLT